LSSLLEVSHNVASTLELKSLLGLILEQLKIVADYDGTTVAIVEGEHLVIIDYQGTGRESMLGWRFPLKQLGLIWQTIRRQEVVIVEDVYGETPLALAYQQAAEIYLEREGLVAALVKQGAALQARHDIVVQTYLCEEPRLSLKAKQELYLGNRLNISMDYVPFNYHIYTEQAEQF
jgi:hypothetical protein